MYSNEALDQKIKSMDNKIDTFVKDSKEERRITNSKIDSLGDKLTEFILKVETSFLSKTEANEKFANKITEKLVYGAVGLMLTAVIVGILNLVI